MTNSEWLVPAAAAWGAAALGTAVVGKWARSRRLLDVPNDRSSHQEPTPRLGGIGIVFGIGLGCGLVAAQGASLGALAPATLGAAIIFLLGLADDLLSLNVVVRMVVQAVAAATVVAAAGSEVSAIGAPWIPLLPVWLAGPVAVIWIMWCTNLFNFMDGMNGLAAGQAIVGSLALSLVAWRLGQAETSLVLICIAAAVGGFLPFNFPGGWIFMGDSGSTTLGFMLASCSFVGGSRGVPAIAVVLALGLFVLDATTTLVRRVLRGERVHVAHRTHCYQRALAVGVAPPVVAVVAWLGMLLAGAASVHAGGQPSGAGAAVVATMLVYAGMWGVVTWKERRQAKAQRLKAAGSP